MRTGKYSNQGKWGLGMALRTRAVSVNRLPERLDVKRGRLFFRELAECMNVERPCIVLDCSLRQEIDKHTLHLLLCCLEGAIKRNGDVRLAAVTPAAMLSLEFAGIDRLFKIFVTVDEAVQSFENRVAHTLPQAGGAMPKGHETSANAA